VFDLNSIVNSFQNNPQLKNTALTGLGGLAAGMLLSGGKADRLLGNTLKLGAAAAVGGLAWSAWQKYQQNQGTASAGMPETEQQFLARAQPAGEEMGKSLVRAMIAAAKADGQIDAAEKTAIFSKLEAMSLGAQEQAWVFDQMMSPLDIDAVVAPASTPEMAAEIYTASLAAMTADTPAERAYLDELAQKLRLDPELVKQIEATVR
jgi:uncharacterized membrane protein YebE (DUF533 family)